MISSWMNHELKFIDTSYLLKNCKYKNIFAKFIICTQIICKVKKVKLYRFYYSEHMNKLYTWPFSWLTLFVENRLPPPPPFSSFIQIMKEIVRLLWASSDNWCILATSNQFSLVCALNLLTYLKQLPLLISKYRELPENSVPRNSIPYVLNLFCKPKMNQ